MGGILPPIPRNDRLPGRGARGQPPLSPHIPTPSEICEDIERLVLEPRRRRAQYFGAFVIAEYRSRLAAGRRNPGVVSRPIELLDTEMQHFAAEMARHGWKIGFQSLNPMYLSVEPLDERLR